MPFQSYIQDPVRGFTAAEQAALGGWYNDLDAQDPWRVIRRNFGRECDRDDIDHGLYADFLRDIARIYRSNQPDPIVFITSTFGSARSRYLLPGRRLATTDGRLSRVMRLEHLVKYNLHKAGVPVSYDLSGAVSALQSGAIVGANLAGSVLGRPDSPVWVCETDSIAGMTDPDRVRDFLGLFHIAIGHLVELQYGLPPFFGPVIMTVPPGLPA